MKNDFKVVGYFYGGQDTKNNLSEENFKTLTHIIYAFAIPTSDGDILPLENPSLAKELIEKAHKTNTKVLIALGGYSYNDERLDATFVKATQTPEKTQILADNIIKLCDEYGFDGIDVDWEFPDTENQSYSQYEEFVLLLKSKLQNTQKLLTVAVIGGINEDGEQVKIALGQPDKVLDCVDFVNIMAYDGSEINNHLSYDFAISCAEYWMNFRKVKPEKLILGVPFYARPLWPLYKEIVDSYTLTDDQDIIIYKDTKVYFNGVQTIKDKTNYALQNLGGIMIWEISQDTIIKEKSLINAISTAIAEQ